MHWEKSVPSNLFRIAGIPVNRSSDKRGLSVFGIDSGIDLIVKTHKISKLSLLVGTAHLLHQIVCSYEHGAENILSLSNIQQMPVVQQ